MGTMTHVRMVNSDQNASARNPVERRAARAVAIGLDPRALEPARPSVLVRTSYVVGELLTAVAIIGGGMALTAFASLH